jgi:hypothetical protein
MAEAVDHTLVVEDAIGGDEIVDQCGVGWQRLRTRGRNHDKPRQKKEQLAERRMGGAKSDTHQQ